jgi:opacity protein-like surface antigen
VNRGRLKWNFVELRLSDSAMGVRSAQLCPQMSWTIVLRLVYRSRVAGQTGFNPSKREKMKSLLLVALLVIVSASAAQAQDDREVSLQANANVAADFASTSAAMAAPRTPAVSLLANPSPFAEPRSVAEPPEPSPATPDPRFAYGSRDDYRWQLALGVSLVRFRSSFYYATGVGTNTSITYFTNDWFGLEGNVNTSFAPTIYRNEHVKFFDYGAGPKIAWRGRKLEPWAHAIAGGMHVLPQTAGHSQNGFALQVGGGVDYRFYPHLSARAGVDWVKTHVFGEWGNSAQANVDVVLHF